MKTSNLLSLIVLLLPAAFGIAEAPVELSGRVVTVEKITPIIDKAEKTYHVRRAERRPVIDGKANEWSEVPATVVGGISNGKSRVPERDGRE